MNYRNSSSITCCYNCQDRTIDCHGTCEKYRRQVDRRKAENEKILKERKLSYYMHEENKERVKRDRINRYRKRKGI